MKKGLTWSDLSTLSRFETATANKIDGDLCRGD
jgi:hypothetical protein